MLLPIKDETPCCSIFDSLNNELGFFLNSCIPSDSFKIDLFSPALRDAIWDNQATKDKFQVLWGVISKLSPDNRRKLSATYQQSQKIDLYYQNKTIELPIIPESIFKPLAEVGKHLFSRASKLKDIETCCHETIKNHFISFRHWNHNVCCICCTDVLAPFRANVDEDDQWRGPYDHLLPKEKYPLFAVHPKNLMPICDKCNSKAKLAKDLLRQKENQSRRLCFFPFSEHAHEHVAFLLEEDEMNLTAVVTMNTEHPSINEKLTTWDDVFRIKERVEGEFLTLIDHVDSDCSANNYQEFQEQISRKAAGFKNTVRLTPWHFWKFKLYSWLRDHGAEIVETLWEMILAKRNDADAAEVYGI